MIFIIKIMILISDLNHLDLNQQPCQKVASVSFIKVVGQSQAKGGGLGASGPGGGINPTGGP